MLELIRSSSTSMKHLEQELAEAQTPEELCRATPPPTDSRGLGARRRPRTD